MNIGQKPKRAKLFPVYVVAGVAEGKTKLSAFDGALEDAGVSNFNLLHLSSVIPPHAVVKIGELPLLSLSEKIGNRLYVVYARHDEDRPGKRACAGLGWALTVDHLQWGLFVEHVGENETDVAQQIQKSISCMTERRTRNFGYIFGTKHQLITSIVCTILPVCAVVIAVYKDESW